MGDLQCNITDTALIFEGGGMRASYTAAVAVALIENGMNFSHVYGVSAGSSNSVNYVSRDVGRTKWSFTTLMDDKKTFGTGKFLAHKGWFNAHYIYQEICQTGRDLEYDFETFCQNPAQVTIASTERDTGRSRFWTKEDMPTLDDLMIRVRASSTLPIVMPPANIEGSYHYDGGLAEGNGILLEQARRDGFEKFLVVRTRPRGYRKPLAPNPWAMAFFWRRPRMREALTNWGPGYNAVCDELERLEAQGSAYVFYAEDMAVENNTTDVGRLLASYDSGQAQIRRDLPAIERFLRG